MAGIKTKRQIPKYGQLQAILRFRNPLPSKQKDRLNRALTIHDLREIARKRTPQEPFDYTDGAADEEISLKKHESALKIFNFSRTFCGMSHEWTYQQTC